MAKSPSPPIALAKLDLEEKSFEVRVRFKGKPAVDVTDYLEHGIASLRCHQAYITGLGGDFDPDRFLRSGASFLGPSLGCEFAVSFELVPL